MRGAKNDNSQGRAKDLNTVVFTLKIGEEYEYEVLRLERQEYMGRINVKISALGDVKEMLSPIKFYRFFPRTVPEATGKLYLEPPRRRNILQLIKVNSSLRRVIVNLLQGLKYKLKIDPTKEEVGFYKEIDGLIIEMPFNLLSDTIQRVMLFLAAIKTNKDSVITMEEPEAHAYPFYTKFLAEVIARRKENQYLISTHNPYFLETIIEKTPLDELAVFACTLEHGRIKLTPLDSEVLEQILGGEIDVLIDIKQALRAE